MGTDMSRFVLLSAALHASVLAALGYGATRPAPFPPASLAVTLTASRPASADMTHHRAHQRRAAQRGPSHAPVAPANDPEPSVPSPRRKPQPVADGAGSSKRVQDTGNINHGDEAAARTLPMPEPRPAAAANDIHNDESEPAAAPALRHADAARLASQLEGQVRDALAPYFAYPVMARRNGWQGQVRVGLRVEADGHLSHVHVAQSSGYPLLDDAAVATLNRVITVPKAAGWLDGHHFDMVLPIEYRLIDGRS